MVCRANCFVQWWRWFEFADRTEFHGDHCNVYGYGDQYCDRDIGWGRNCCDWEHVGDNDGGRGIQPDGVGIGTIDFFSDGAGVLHARVSGVDDGIQDHQCGDYSPGQWI
jgi:hypothetical protein